MIFASHRRFVPRSGIARALPRRSSTSIFATSRGTDGPDGAYFKKSFRERDVEKNAQGGEEILLREGRCRGGRRREFALPILTHIGDPQWNMKLPPVPRRTWARPSRGLCPRPWRAVPQQAILALLNWRPGSCGEYFVSPCPSQGEAHGSPYPSQAGGRARPWLGLDKAAAG